VTGLEPAIPISEFFFYIFDNLLTKKIIVYIIGINRNI